MTAMANQGSSVRTRRGIDGLGEEAMMHDWSAVVCRGLGIAAVVTSRVTAGILKDSTAPSVATVIELAALGAILPRLTAFISPVGLRLSANRKGCHRTQHSEPHHQ